MVWQREGGEGRGREYQYEFFYLIAFMKDCISEGWQSQGSRMSEGPSHKGWEKNNGIPPHTKNAHRRFCLQHITHFPPLYL